MFLITPIQAQQGRIVIVVHDVFWLAGADCRSYGARRGDAGS
jgi:hypothetical protein